MDPLNLILLVIAVLVGLKLRSVLGTRNDGDKSSKRRDPYRLNRDAFETKNNDPSDPIQTPVHPPIQQEAAQEAKQADSDIGGRGVAYLREVEPDFDEAAFLQGGARAYEMILTAFARGDLADVRAFLGADVLASFEAAIAARQADGQRLVTRVVRLERPILDDARVDNNHVQLDVSFRAELISLTCPLEMVVDEDDLPDAATVNDVWTFERPLKAADPSWQLVATQGA